MKYTFLIIACLIFGCGPVPTPDPSNTDSTYVELVWEILDKSDDGNPCFFSKQNGDSVTLVAVDGCFVAFDMPYVITQDVRLENRRMISIGSAFNSVLDSSMWFNIDRIPDSLDYDKYSPNMREIGQ